MQLHRIKRVIAGTAHRLMLNHTLSFAAALSYYFVLAFFPAMIALAALLAYLPVPNLFDTMIAGMARVAPPESMGIVRNIVTDVISPNHGLFLSFGLIGTVWTCSSGFSAIIEGLDVAFDASETRPLWKTRLLSLELTFLIGTQVTLAFTFMIVGPAFGEFLAAHLGLSKEFALAWPILRYVVAITFIVIAIEELYFLAPNLKQRFVNTLPGAIVAVCGWMVLSDALSYYFRAFANLNRTYGVLGGGVALLIWLYWSGFLLLLGAEVNHAITCQRKKETLIRKQLAVH